MKKLNYLFLMYLSIVFVTVSCSDKDDAPLPQPTATFSQDRLVVEAGEVVTFQNTTTNAERYEWDFGNGTSSTVLNPTAQYTKTGTYNITLTAYNKENVKSVKSAKVIVGSRYLKSIVVNNINFSTSNGGNWDIGSGPDLQLYLGESGAINWALITSVANNITQANLPVTFNLNSPLKLTDKKWSFAIIDDDSSVGSYELMYSWEGEILKYGQKSYQDGKGSLKFTGGAYDIDFNFEVKE